MNNNLMLSTSQAAAVLGVSTQTLRAWAKRGVIPHTLLPSGHYRWTREQIAQIRMSQTREPVQQAG